MTEPKLVAVDPGELHLPPERQDGPDPMKLLRQLRLYGVSAKGMPLIVVLEGRGGQRMILDGVTRATRLCLMRPGEMVEVEVVALYPEYDLSLLPRVRDRLP